MLAETVRTVAITCFTNVLTISVIAGIFNLFGNFFVKIARLPTFNSNSFLISVGMVGITFFGRYIDQTNISLINYLTIIFSISLVVIVYIIILTIRSQENKSSFIFLNYDFYLFPCFVLFFTLQSLIAFKTAVNPIGLIGNNDIYNWSLTADHLLGEPGYFNVIPSGKDIGKDLLINSWGTYFILAFISNLVSLTAIESTSYFTIFYQSVIALISYEIVRQLFHFNRITSFLIALLSCLGAFLFYIDYNNFYGEIIATFFYLVGILIIIKCTESVTELSFIKKVLLVSIPLIGMLLVYTNGFVLFSLFLIFWSFVLVTVNCPNSFYLRLSEIKIWVCIFGCAILMIGLLLPKLFYYTIQWSFGIANVAAGWHLPLISPFTLVNFPGITQNFPGDLSTNLIQYIFEMSVLFLLLTFSYLNLRRKTPQYHLGIFSIMVFFCISLTVYFVGYAVKGDTYQVWKAAAFLIMPLGFVFSAMMISNIYYFTKDNWFIRQFTIALLVPFCFFSLLQPGIFPYLSLRSEINQLKLIKKSLKNQPEIENIVLGIKSPQDTILAFNVLSSRNIQLFPVTATFISPADPASINQLDSAKTRILVYSRCLSAKHTGYELITIEDYFFSTHLFSCGSGEIWLKGFADLEPWGGWTNGFNASVKIEVPARFADKAKVVQFDVTPFVVDAKFHSISVKLNGYYSGTWNLNKRTMLELNVPPSLAKASSLTFDFYIADPQKPMNLAASQNTELLGVGFISYRIIGPG